MKAAGVHHVGITVSDLERSVAWYSTLLGLVGDMSVGGSGESLERIVQVPGASTTGMLLKAGNTRLELIQYHSPPGLPFSARNCDVGASHVCFEVSDIHEAYEELIAEGVVFSTPPQYIDSGDLEGYTVVYFRDPDGLQLELIQLPAS
jgi:catechol 2,3-dioxygenase-like lactoylglutathione lyase family enzyme